MRTPRIACGKWSSSAASAGRLSEFLGGRAFDTDKLMRTLGIARMAERIVARLDRDTMKSLEAYCAGVNAYVDAQPVLPVEFQVFRMKPERWKPADTVGWLLVMAWDLSANWRTELARLRFAVKLGPERANEIIPPYPGDAPIPLPDFRRSTPSSRRPPMRCWPLSPARTTRTDRTAGWSPARAARQASLSLRTTRTWDCRRRRSGISRTSPARP
jgi:acyl-homoserine lactone acylase PvdQ